MISIITSNTKRQYKTNVATEAPNAAPTSLYWTIYFSIKKANNIIRLIVVLSYTRTIINMSNVKDDKNKKPKGLLVITKQSPKKAKLGSLDIQFTAINHTCYFRGPQCCPDVLGTKKYKMQLNKKK
jgi:hypothetical protein